jgi:hypothetical protein
MDRAKIATLEDAIRLRRDLGAYGSAFVDADGRRVDPADVVVANDGSTTDTAGATVFLPEPLNLREDR